MMVIIYTICVTPPPCMAAYYVRYGPVNTTAQYSSASVVEPDDDGVSYSHRCIIEVARVINHPICYVSYCAWLIEWSKYIM
jgi:hypothetical protein